MSILDLFKPKWKHSDPDKRSEAIEIISDQALLADVAKEGKQGYHVGELPSDTPGKGVLLKASFVEPLLRMGEVRLATGTRSQEEQIVALAANLAGWPESYHHQLLNTHEACNLVYRVDDCQSVLSNPKLPEHWAVPGYLVTLFASL